MEKETFETYEFLSCNISNNEMNPLFVLRDDGTILSVNCEVQYIQEVENPKEDPQACSNVFDVSSQQYYVNVDNTTELLTVPEQFTTTDESQINSFLIQPDVNTICEQMETEPTEEFKPDLLQTSKEENTITKSTNNNLTEITLTDGQYQMLEQMGWILLECNERIFILNTLGLHDITTNEKLVQKMKNEVQEYNNKLLASLENENKDNVKVENVSTVLTINNLDEEAAVVKFFVNESSVPSTENVELSNTEEQPTTSDIKCSETADDCELTIEDDPLAIPDTLPTTSEDSNCIRLSQKCDAIRIKTKYVFHDIPEKIFLGKTVNGKKLYARAKKSKYNRIVSDDNNKYIVYCGNKYSNTCNMTDSQFINLVQESVRRGGGAAGLAGARALLAQLLAEPRVTHPLLGHRLVFTKVVTYTDADVKFVVNKPTIITGFVNRDENGEPKFTHVPDMLQKLAELDDEQQSLPKKMISLYHIHIAKSKINGNIPNQAIHIMKRKLSLDVLRDTKKKYPDPMFACAACAAVFKTESLLKEHQENHCFETDDALMIDTDKLNRGSDHYTVVEIGDEKWYSCTQCEAKFARLFNCQKHIKTHDISTNPNSDSDDPKQKTAKKIYKCKMCPSTYFHSSSLSKHIVKVHITV